MRKFILILTIIGLPVLLMAQLKNVHRSGERAIELEPITIKPRFGHAKKLDIQTFQPQTLKKFQGTHHSSKHLKVQAFDGTEPIWISGRIEDAKAKSWSLEEQSINYIREAGQILKSQDPDEEWRINSIEKDDIQQNHIRVNQYHKGVRVYGTELILHEKDGYIYQMNGKSFPTPEITKITPGLKGDSVEQISWTLLKDDSKLTANSRLYEFLDLNRFEKELVIYHKEEVPILSWHIRAYPNPAEMWELFIDANSGQLIHKFKNNCNFVPDFIQEDLACFLPPPEGDETANATDLNNETQTIHTYETGGLYYLLDASRSMYQGGLSNMPNEPVGAIWTIDAMNSSPQRSDFNYDHVQSNNNSWGHSREGVSAHNNGGKSYEYFKTVHNRESINGDGGNIISLVNVTDEDDRSMDNAFWNGAAIFYGNGDVAFDPLAKALDVASHEMTHGVVQSKANLEYYGESGAMNESFADIFATMIDRDDWLIGEDVVRTNVFPSGALRSLSDPHNGQSPGDFNKGWQPKHVSEQFTGSEDNNGVHLNSGIPNHAFYLFATAVGKNKAEKVFYRALQTYLTRTSKFIDLRLAAIKSAEDLYGSAEVNAAKSAFDQVGILGDEGSPPPIDSETNEGLDLVLFTDPNRTKLLLADYTNSLLYDPFSNTAPISRPSITDDGANIVFIGSDKKMYLIQIDWESGNPPTEEVIQNQAIWANVVIAKDGSRIAAVTEDLNNVISVFDFSVGLWNDYTLYNPTYTEGVSTGDVLYADAMEFDFTGEWLMYDANNNLPSSTTGGIDYWDIGFIQVWDNAQNDWGNGLVQKLFAALPEGISIGNPTFSKNSPFIVAFDFIERGDYKLFGANIETGDVSEIFTTPNLSYPSYSRNDLQLIYDSNFDFFIDIGILNLKANKIERIEGTEDILLSDARWGVWFSNGERELTSSTQDLLLGIEELMISPNPFKNQINVQLKMEDAHSSKIELIDIKGQIYFSEDWQISAGQNQKTIGIENLPVGPYLLRFAFEDSSFSKLIIKGE